MQSNPKRMQLSRLVRVESVCVCFCVGVRARALRALRGASAVASTIGRTSPASAAPSAATALVTARIHRPLPLELWRRRVRRCPAHAIRSAAVSAAVSAAAVRTALADAHDGACGPLGRVGAGDARHGAGRKGGFELEISRPNLGGELEISHDGHDEIGPRRLAMRDGPLE
jgi:hypothetical protein